MGAIHLKCFRIALDMMRGKAGNPYEASRSSDAVANYIATPAHPEYKRINYSMVASTRSSQGEKPIRVEVVFEKIEDRDWNREKMQALEVYRKQIEESFGNKLEWKPKAGKKGNPGVAWKVIFEGSEFYEGLQEDNVDDVARWLADNMLKLVNAVKPYITKI